MIVSLVICLILVYSGYFWGYKFNKSIDMNQWFLGGVSVAVVILVLIAQIYIMYNSDNFKIERLFLTMMFLPVFPLVLAKITFPIVSESDASIKTGDTTHKLLEKATFNLEKPYDKLFIYPFTVYCFLTVSLLSYVDC